MSEQAYNYTHFNPGAEAGKFLEFARQGPLVTERAPSFPVEDLETGKIIEMKELWRKGVVVIEFGSFS